MENKRVLTNEELIEKALTWFNMIIEDCDRLTSGNVSHESCIIRGRALRSKEFIEKHSKDPGEEIISLIIQWFDSVIGFTKEITTGNVSHYGPLIKWHCKNSIYYIENYGRSDKKEAVEEV